MRFANSALRRAVAVVTVGLFALLGLGLSPATAATTSYWGLYGPGMGVQVNDHGSQVHLAGTSTAGVWSGARATTANQMPAQGTLNVVLRGNLGNNCEEGTCPFGKGSGYKAVAEFRFDDANYYQIGVQDEGYVTWGPMLVVSGTHLGKPFQVFEPLVTDAQRANNADMLRKIQAGQAVDLDQQHYVRDYRHLIKAQWTRNYIMFVVDNTRVFGGYNFTAGDKNGPSVTFVGAAKNPGDGLNAIFDAINFSGRVPGSTVFIPQGKPYAAISADLQDTGYGVGHSAYIKLHDEYGSAVSAGIQTASTSPETGGAPWVISGRMQDGIFDYDYIQPSSHDSHNLRIEWWKESGWAVIWYDGKPVANMKAKLKGRLYASIEGNAAQNGDFVHSYFKNVKAEVGHDTVSRGDCGFHNSWDPTGTYGINVKQNGNNFEVWGTAQGIPAGKDWDTTLVGATAIAFQYLPENGQNGSCFTQSWAADPAHNKVG